MSVNMNMAILVVDDYATMLRIITNQLRQLGFSVVDQAAGGHEALAKLNDKKYGLIISDLLMEPMSGLDLLKNVRATPAWKDIPFIMVTAESTSENVVAAKEAGVNNYIVKPFNVQTLKKKMESVIGEF